MPIVSFGIGIAVSPYAAFWQVFRLGQSLDRRLPESSIACRHDFSKCDISRPAIGRRRPSSAGQSERPETRMEADSPVSAASPAVEVARESG